MKFDQFKNHFFVLIKNLNQTIPKSDAINDAIKTTI